MEAYEPDEQADLSATLTCSSRHAENIAPTEHVPSQMSRYPESLELSSRHLGLHAISSS